MQNNILYLDKEGKQNLIEMINNLNYNLDRVIEKMNYLKNNKFDKDKYNELLNLKEDIERRIIEKKEFLNNAILIDENLDDDKIKLHDVVKINTYFDATDIETELYELVSGENNFDSEIKKLSINTSPLGKLLYGKNVGDSLFLNINNEKLKIEVLEKVNIKKLKKSI